MNVLLYALVAVFTLVTVILLAATARRLLSLRFSLTRTLVAGAIAFPVAEPLFERYADTPGPRVAASPPSGCWRSPSPARC